MLADPLRDQPWGQRSAAVAAAAQEQPVIDTVLKPGDALYLPRGWLHAAAALRQWPEPASKRVTFSSSTGA